MKKPEPRTESRKRYQEKRLGEKYFRKRKVRIKNWQESSFYHPSYKTSSNEIINLKAPVNFSFIENTDELLEYINYGRYNLKNKNQILFDISDIKSITPDVIPFLLSHIKDVNFNFNVPIHGNGPKDEKFRQIFTESGFYNHVRSKKKYKVGENNIMHREANYKVKSDIAANAVELIIQKCSCTDDFIEPIYNIFIELMSNTHHHADLQRYGSSKWWLYVFADIETNKVSLSFTDLGVGIFKSMVVRSYLKKFGLSIKLVDNTSLVDDLLSGKIQSRIDVDNEIRGKGIPQIVEYSKLNCFEKFILVTNNIKVDLKSNTWNKLSSSFKGTFYYIEFKNYNHEQS